MGSKDRDKTLSFLTDLQKELSTQEIDSQASPRFWVLMDYKFLPTDSDYADETHYVHADGDCVQFGKPMDLIEFLEEHEELDELPDYQNMDLDDLFEWIEVNELNEDGCYQIVPVMEVAYIVENTLFLSKQEAKDYIKNNSYNHTSRIHTYAMTAHRAPKTGKVIEMLTEADWTKYKRKKTLISDLIKKIFRWEQGSHEN
ncbi:hypothetical protein BMT55_00010 [Listeria newyorkensis]|uniref:Uncharacterized protein n=1 Tax=Listeria newyorkensis TaxID=1497681 RepID=A0ABX4XR69_9LIST|nr:hypothetical protein [Listeria newyorkensis]PNP94777.1 hypothetical protein BMT55_00010 [Listeria newyorkensis]